MKVLGRAGLDAKPVVHAEAPSTLEAGGAA